MHDIEFFSLFGQGLTLLAVEQLDARSFVELRRIMKMHYSLSVIMDLGKTDGEKNAWKDYNVHDMPKHYNKTKYKMLWTFHFVFFYRGNLFAEPPYQTGSEPCSACPGDKPYCMNKLCSKCNVLCFNSDSCNHHVCVYNIM